MEKYIIPEAERAALERLRQPFAVYQFIDKKVVTLLLSDGFCGLFGYGNRAEALFDMDHNMYRDTHPDDAARIANAAVVFATEGGSYDVVYRTKKKDGCGYSVVHALGEHVYPAEGVRLAHIWYTDEGTYAEDTLTVGELTAKLSNALHEQSILKATHYDFLTGLPNMTYFFELAEAGKRRILKNGGQPMLLYFDFSGMKFFNTRYGFAEGDKMLRSFAKLLVRAFSNEGSCRIGVDHFAAIAEEAGLEARLELLFGDFGKLYEGHTPPVHAGIYPYRIEDVPVSSACDRAKLACKAIRDAYVSGFRYYCSGLRETSVLKRYIIENLDTAIRDGWIEVYLQPIVRTVTGQVCDVEALARWNDPVKGLLSPSSFVPVLEDAGLIYRLDLYMLEQVLEHIRTETDAGLAVIPHSINLSRSDFDACDIVEEIRSRVDAAGIRRDRITIEVTESIIGSDFDFMKKQVERFRALGFPVWMDDFGSGYSSLDLLQSIRFDLIKFDMSFMRKFDAGDESRVILTELMRMATSLDVDTVCEGVEYESQLRFLKDIGCSKLQGYYFSRPIPFERLRELCTDDPRMETENPAESDYYETIGRANIFDLGLIAGEEDSTLRHTFSSIPIAILEVKDDRARYVRGNRSYQKFMKQVFDLDIQSKYSDFRNMMEGAGPVFSAVLRQCCQNGNRTFFDEQLNDGSVVHAFARRIKINPVTGSTSVAVAVLSITEPEESMTYAEIARALAADYYNIYAVDLDTDSYIEYSSRIGAEELAIERHGTNFFESARQDALTRICDEDRELFLKQFTKERILHELDEQSVFTAVYRQIEAGKPIYVNMKITRMRSGNRIIIGISVIDAQMKLQEEEKRLKQERLSLGRIASLSPNYIVLYTVDLETGHYTQYNPSNEFERFGLARQGEDFFADVLKNAPKTFDPDHIERHLRVFTKKNILREIQKNGLFIHNYRLMMDGKSVPVSLRATMAPPEEGAVLLIGVANDDREDYRRKVEEAYEKERDSSRIFTHIALALARNCTDLFYVNMDTDAFIEYHTDDEPGVLTEARRRTDFFEGCERDAKLYVHPEDQDMFTAAMTRDFLQRELDRSNHFEMIYRRIKNGRTFYVRMRVTPVEEDRHFIVVAVQDIDEEMQQRRVQKQVKEERTVYARLNAITGNFSCIFVVDPESGNYREFNAAADFAGRFRHAAEGEDFFTAVREAAKYHTHPDDTGRVLSLLTRENILAEIDRMGTYTLTGRIMLGRKAVYFQFKAAMADEDDGRRLIVGLKNIDAQVRQEEEFEKRLAKAQSQASVDALTGVRNKHAYLEMEAQMDRLIARHRQSPFAIVLFDVNDLKKVNDSRGHQAGDQYLRDTCRIICEVFKHSPVFRVGGDEFTVIAQGADFEQIEDRLLEMERHNREALRSGGIVIACGMARFENDPSVAPVFSRADQNMYENKNLLKSAGQTDTSVSPPA